MRMWRHLEKPLRRCKLRLLPHAVKSVARTVAPAVATDAPPQQATSVLRELQRFLDSTLHELDSQIRDYPTPIPRCDAQFNHLYEQRACAVRELAILRSASTDGAALRAIAETTLQHAPYGESEIERRLRGHLETLRC